MNRKLRIIAFCLLSLSAAADAAPVKCVVDGKTSYSDDNGTCPQPNVRPITGEITVIQASAPRPDKTTAAASNMKAPGGSWLDSIFEAIGITPKDFENGWKTVQEAKQRGTWEAPQMPDEEK